MNTKMNNLDTIKAKIITRMMIERLSISSKEIQYPGFKSLAMKRRSLGSQDSWGFWKERAEMRKGLKSWRYSRDKRSFSNN